jgi:hypothetical protein
MEASTQGRLKGTFEPDVPTEKLKLHPRNPRIGDVSKIKESLAKHGQARPIVVDEDYVIIAGNHTWKAAKELGWPAIDVYKMPYDYNTATSYLVADNRLSDLGTYNDEELLSLLSELMETDNLAGTGFTPSDVDDILVNMGEVTNAPAGSGDENFTTGETADHWQRPEEGAPPAVPMKDVTLNYPLPEWEQFEAAFKKLQKEWGIASVRGVVLTAVLRCAGMEVELSTDTTAEEGHVEPEASDPQPAPDPSAVGQDGNVEEGMTVATEATGGQDEPDQPA